MGLGWRRKVLDQSGVGMCGWAAGSQAENSLSPQHPLAGAKKGSLTLVP